MTPENGRKVSGLSRNGQTGGATPRFRSKTARQNITLQYRKSLAIIPSFKDYNVDKVS